MSIYSWLAFLSMMSVASSFEVPFPQSSAQIRASISSSSGSSDDAAASLNTQINKYQPITRQIQLGSGTMAEVISCIPPKQTSTNDMMENMLSSLLFGQGTNTKKKKKPALAFLHGSFHASWCWAEKYMPYFASLGYPCVAFSLQGTGGTPTMELGAKKVKIASHVADLDAFLKGLADSNDDDATKSLGLELGENPKIVLIGHSFGGLTIMKWLEQRYDGDERNTSNNKDINLAGVGLMCSVPPSGNGKMTMRFIRRSLKDAWKITVGFVLKKAITDKTICRDLFFGGGTEDTNGITDEDIARYQSYFERDTVATIDLSDLAKKLPSALADKDTGRAPFVDQLPPVFVIGASEDFIVDKEGVEETARYMGLEEPLIVDSPHDIMLGRRWNNGAEAILDFVQKV
ncbi:hypothetical protein ACHAWC_006846 [Mediolabrus comicus]